eukprot:GSChrysophyteH1.ASY1.ANO1.1688.1 assembled CDS
MEFTARDVDGIKAEAAAKGMMAVDQNSANGLIEDYDEKLALAMKLCDVVDPVEKPYDSKYKARKILDDLVNQLEATRTVSMMEGRRDTVYEMNWRAAACQVKIGTICWEVDEPHHAQDELERAASYYSPGFVQSINDMVGDTGSENESSSQETSSRVSLSDPPEVSLPRDSLVLCIDAMQCLNMLGILWAGRGVVAKSFLYLVAANNLYERGKKHTDKLHAGSSSFDRRKARDMESVYTHNLFYLAQAYGHVGDSKKSGEQLNSRFESKTAALDWVKNCVGISDFYIALGHYRRCALALISAECVLLRFVLESADNIQETQSEEDARVLATEVHADLNRRIAHLDVLVLKRAFERQLFKESCAESALDFEEPFFAGLSVPAIPYLCAGDIETFEHARAVFLRASVRLDASKKFYLLEGYVSDHVALVQEQSKLYHYLAAFETEPKRKMAMENKRIDMLTPLLGSLNPVPFEGFHKELSYEIAETYMTLHDVKIEKLRARRPDGVVSGDYVKKAELENCNMLCHKSIAMFTHYLSFFAPASDTTARGAANFIAMERGELVNVVSLKPNLAAISEDEVRSFLNSHFLSCRMLSKMLIAPGATPSERSQYIARSLKRYEWIVKFTPQLCESKGVSREDIFGEEYSICKDMVELLPAKINRIHHLGENPII